MTFIGIDPGQSGGIAFVDEHDLGAHKMPDTERDIFELLRDLAAAGPAVARIERVSSSPQMGVVSAFTFGSSYGGLRMALIAAGIPFEEVSPVKWQREMGCLTKGDKNVSKAKAQQLFPLLKVTHSIADALLIAEFCRRTHVRS